MQALCSSGSAALGSVSSPLTYFYGHDNLGKNPELYKRHVDRLAACVDRRMEADKVGGLGGVLDVNGCVCRCVPPSAHTSLNIPLPFTSHDDAYNVHRLLLIINPHTPPTLSNIRNRSCGPRAPSSTRRGGWTGWASASCCTRSRCVWLRWWC